MFAVLRDLTETDRVFVIRALQGRSRPRASARERMVLAALERCQQDLGEQTISKRRYERWRDGHAERGSLPSSKMVAGVLGGTWSAAMHRAGVRPAGDHRGERLSRMGGWPTDEQALDAIAECAAALRVRELSFAAYRNWARGEMAAGGREPALLISMSSMLRRFGSWAQAVDRAGVGLVSGPAGPTTVCCRYSTPHMLWVIQQAHAQTVSSPGKPLTVLQYEHWRRAATGEAEGPDGRPTRPNGEAIKARLGSWPDALLAAGVMSAAQAHSYVRGHGKRLPAQLVARVLWRAYEQLDGRLTAGRYANWRRAHRDDPDVGYAPHPAGLRRRCGPLPTVAVAIGEIISRDGDVTDLEEWIQARDNSDE